jgi:hypothetical protein
MKYRQRREVRLVAGVVLATLVLVSAGAGVSTGADRTVKEFKEYAAGKLPGLSEAKLDRFAKMVDKDADGVISDAEFGARMAAAREILRGGSTPKAPKESAENPNKKKPDEKEPAERPAEAPQSAVVGKAAVLLITGDDLAVAWRRFADWKTKNGKATKIVTVARIDKQYKGGSIQEKIRLCVREHIEKHDTRWVILGGDCEPGGKGVVPGGHLTVHSGERSGPIPTDIVYLSKTNWDADGDGRIGEWKDDREAITYPDGKVGLGRIPLRTARDVSAFTDKVISYESKYPTDGFAKQIIYTCTERGAYPKVRKSWDGFLSKVWKGGKMGRFFAAETPWDQAGRPGSYPLSAKNLSKLINDKTTGKMHIHGHGLLPLWVLEGSKFTTKDAGKLTNEGAYPLMTTVSCFTGQYDGKADPSIVEAMVRCPKGGSVAVVAPIRTGKPHFHKRSDFRLMVSEGKLDGTTQTMTRYWSNGLGGGLTTGQALMKAKAAMVPDALKTANFHLCICELNLLGDPTLDMRADTSRSPKLKCPGALAKGKQSVTVYTDAPGSTICLWKGTEVYAVATADAKGKSEFAVNLSSPGNLLVSVSGASLNSISKTIVVK